MKAGESASAISREMNIPRTTLLSWQKNDVATSAGARKKIRVREKNATVSTGGKKSVKSEEEAAAEKEKKRKETLVANKKKFSNDSWDNISKAQKIINRRLDRALKQEGAIDEIVDIVLNAKDEELSEEQKKSLLHKLRKIRVDDVRDVVVVIGTLYDKQALANDEATNIVDGGLQVEFNIPRPPKKEK